LEGYARGDVAIIFALSRGAGIMFSGLKQRWAEARVGPVSEYVLDILARYERMNPLDKDLVLRSFRSVLSQFEEEYGSAGGWSNELRLKLAKQLFSSAKTAASNPYGNIDGEMTRISANGVAMLSFYIELQALNGRRASDLVRTINVWSERPSGYNP
jgi:hypothetical protein